MRDSLQSFLSHIETLHPKPIDLGLERISIVLKRLIPGTFQCPVVTIAGTNGKGSTATALTALAMAAGKKVATYTSPHLIDFNERIAINAQPISDEDAFNALKRVDEARGEVSLTYFEWVTLAALHYFYEQQPDLVILEVGMGGRLDAVNMICPTLSIITHIGLDHTQWLGETLEAIAEEKAGIMRKDCPVLIGDAPMGLFLKNKALEVGALPEILGEDFPLLDLKSHLHPRSVALALRAAEHLKYHINSGELKKLLEEVRIPGRFDVRVVDEHTVILDVAHNTDGVKVLCERLKAQGYDTVTIVIGVLADKTLQPLLDELKPFGIRFYTCTPLSPRALPGDVLAEQIGEHARAFGAPDAAFQAALQHPEPILVTGSFYTVGDIARTLTVCYNHKAHSEGALC